MKSSNNCGMKKVAAYADPIKVTSNTLLRYLDAASIAVQVGCNDPMQASNWEREPITSNLDTKSYRPNAASCVQRRNRGRKLRRSSVIFEARTDIIIKGSREIQYGR
jgi:hypothetical protein